MARPVARWVLPVPGGPRNTTFSLAVTKSRVPRWAIRSRFRPRAWSKSNSSNDLAGREPGGPDPALAAVGLAGGRPPVAGRRPGTPHGSRTRPGPVRPAAATASRSVGAFNARVRNASSAVRSRPRSRGLGGHHATAAVGEAEGGVVVAQAADLDLGCGGRAGDSPMRLRAQQPSPRLDMRRVGDGLVLGPDPVVVGHDPPVAEHPHPVQVGDDLDPAADHRRVHGVVVAVQAHVVVPRQPGRGPPPGRRRDRRQRQHRRRVGGDPVGRRAAQRPAACAVFTSPSQPCSWVLKSAGPVNDAAGQEGALQVVVQPLDQALGLRVAPAGRSAPSWPGCRGSAWQSRGQLGAPAAPAADRALAVPDQHPRHRAQRGQQLPPAGEQVLGPPRRDQHRRQPSGSSRTPSSAPAAASRCGSARTRPAA